MPPCPVRAKADSSRITHSIFGLAVLYTAIAAGTAFSTMESAYAQTVVAKEANRQFRIAPGPLSTGLGAFGAQAGVMVASDAALTSGVQTAGVLGTYTVREALERLLAGTGLQAVAGEQGGFRLQPTSSEQAASLAPVTVRGSYSPATTEGTASYTSAGVTIGKTVQSLKDIPQSVSVLTRQRMDDQDMTSLPDAINNTTGMIGVQGVGSGMAINSRGFPVDMLQYDGVPFQRNTYGLGNWEQESLVFYDRVEILRGAAGLLQGTGSPGGAINLVRKRPGAETAVAVTAKAGSWDRYGLQLDAGSPLNASGSLRGRVVVDEDRSGSHIDYVWDRTRNLYVALDYDIGPDTVLGIGVGNRHSRSRPIIVGLPRYADGGDIGLSRSTFTGATWNRAKNEQTTYYADLAHDFNESWRFKLTGVAMNENNISVHQRAAGVVQPDGSGIRYGDFGVDFASRQRGLDMSVSGDFELLGIKQELMLGANYSKLTSDDRYTRAWSAGANIFDLDHNRPWQDIDTIGARDADVRSQYDIRQKGIYGTWRIKPTESLSLIAGGRVSWYEFAYRPAADAETSTTESGRFVPYAGIVYALNENWSVYTSYSSVFEPQSARSVSGDLLTPIEGANYEAGIKGELADGRMNVSLALFRYNHKNRAVNDYDSGYACDDWYCSRASGKVRSQGIEAEVSGEVLPGLQLFGGYTYNTTKYLSDPTNEGQIFNTWMPKHMLRMWADYKLPGKLNRFSVGGGVNMQTDTLSSDRQFGLAGFAIWSARVAYQATPDLSFALKIDNVFDKKYYVPAYNTLSGNNYYGEPRGVMLIAKYALK